MGKRVCSSNRGMIISVALLFLSTIFYPIVEGLMTEEQIDIGKDNGKVVIDNNFHPDPFNDKKISSINDRRLLQLDKTIKDGTNNIQINVDDKELVLNEMWIYEKFNNIISSEDGVINKAFGVNYQDINKNPEIDYVFKNDHYNVKYTSTLTGFKEEIIFRSPVLNISDDLIIQSDISLDNVKPDIRSDNLDKFWFETEDKIDLVDLYGHVIFSIPTPILYESSDSIITKSGPLKINHDRYVQNLKHRIKFSKDDILTYDVIIPDEVFRLQLNYPIYIDPTITSFNGYAEYKGYQNGSVSYYDGTSHTWYEDVDRTVYVESDITVGLNETLVFKNINLTMNTETVTVEVDQGGELNFYDDTFVTRSGSCNGYSIIYKDESRGDISDSIIEKTADGSGIDIQTSDIIIENSIFRSNGDFGLLINQSSPKIIYSDFYSNDIGIKINPFSNPVLYNNNVNDSKIGIYWVSSNIYEDFNNTLNIQTMVGTELDNRSVVIGEGPCENIALECPSVSVSSTYNNPEYHKGRMYDGDIVPSWYNKWQSSWPEPHWAIFDFEEQVNVTSVKIYHYPSYPTYDFTVDFWTGSSWSTEFTVDDNTEAVTNHVLDDTLLTQKVRMYITDANFDQDVLARVREFEIYGDPIDVHYVISEPISVIGDSVFDSLEINKSEPGESQVLISVIDASTNETIPGYSQLDSSVIDLSDIDSVSVPTIKIKAHLEDDGTYNPSIRNWALYYANYYVDKYEFNNYSEFVEYDSIKLLDGHLRLDDKEIFDEKWDGDWESDWNVYTEDDGGEISVIEDYWSNSNYDMYLEGKCLDPSPGHNGYIIFSKFFNDISPYYLLNTHFHGSIDSSVWNYADTFITVYNKTNQTKMCIRWTTRDYNYDGGLSGDTYYIVAQENDPVAPYEYDETIDQPINELFEDYFGDEINWSDYDKFEIMFWSIEHYTQRQNPKVYIDYFSLTQDVEEKGYGKIGPFNIDSDQEWKYLLVNSTFISDTGTELNISLVNKANNTINTSFINLNNSFIDISSLNDENIETFYILIYIELYNNLSPSMNWIKVLSTSLNRNNRIFDNEIGMYIQDKDSMIYQNLFEENGIGILLEEEKGFEFHIGNYQFYITSNIFLNNTIGINFRNVSSYFSYNTFLHNKEPFRMNKTLSISLYNTYQRNEYCQYINDSIFYSKYDNAKETYFYYYLVNSTVSIENLELNNNGNNAVELTDSTLTYVDTYYENITRTFNDASSKVYCTWTMTLTLLDSDETPIGNIYVHAYDRNDLLYTPVMKTDMYGTIAGYTLTERLISQSGQVIYNPYKIKINNGAYTVPLYLSVLHPIIENLYLYGDYDRDGIPDTDEDSTGVYYFTPEDLVMIPDQISESSNYMKNADRVISNKYLQFFNSGDYKIYIRMNTVESGDEANITITVFDEVMPQYCYTFRIDDTPRLASTPTFHLNNDDYYGVNISISSDGTNEIILHDLVIKTINDSYEWVLKNPIDDDFDGDGSIDGWENSKYVMNIEAEELVLDESQVMRAADASNRTSVLGLANDTLINTTLYDLTGNFSIYIKAKSFSTENNNLTISLNSNPVTIHPTDAWNYYLIGNSSLSDLPVVVIKESGSNISVDKLLVKRYDHDGFNNQMLSEMYGPDNQIPIMGEIELDKNWENYLGDRITCKPAITHDHVYYSLRTGEVVKINRSSGKIIDRAEIAEVQYPFYYASTPAIYNNIGYCFFETNAPEESNLIVAFSLIDLTILFNITYPCDDTLRYSGLLVSQGYLFYTFSSTVNLTGLYCRNGQTGEVHWNMSATSQNHNYLSRPTINETEEKLYYGEGTTVCVISNIYLPSPGPTRSTISTGYGNLRSVFLQIDDYNYVTVTQDGVFLKVNMTSQNYADIASIGSDLIDIKLVLDYPYLYGIISGDLVRLNLTTHLFEECECSLEDTRFIYLCQDKIVTSSYKSIYTFNKESLTKLDRILHINNITDLTVCDDFIYFGYKENSMIFELGAVENDPMDIDMDSDDCIDGTELNGNHRKILIEAEDYTSQYSTLYNITHVSMFACYNTSRPSYDVGYGNAGTSSTLDYTVSISEEGRYSFVIRMEPYIVFDPNWEGSNGTAAFFSNDKEYILKALNEIFSVSFSQGGRNCLIEKGYWGTGLGLVSYDINDEQTGGGGCYIWEGIYYLEDGEYNLQLSIDLVDEDYPKTVTVGANYIYIVGANASIDHLFFRVPRISVLDEDSDDDQLNDGYEVSTKMFPLNSDPDMDGISDYYEVNGIPGSYPFDYTGTNPISRDTDRDGIRDRIELGLDGSNPDNYTIYDTEPSIASAYEKAVSDPPCFEVFNSDADPSDQTNPVDCDTDDDGLPDGAIDGLMYEPIYSVQGEYGPRGRDKWYYDGSQTDYHIQFWEGEDFDLDGQVDEGPWMFETFDPNKLLTPLEGETDPCNPDSDNDTLPDGWEAWYVIDPLDSSGDNGRGGDLDHQTSYLFPWQFWNKQIVKDNMTNLEEYLAGTNPRACDTDMDEMIDGDETIHNGPIRMYYWYVNTTIENASISGENYGSSKTDEFLRYRSIGNWFNYEETIFLDGKEHDMRYPDNISSDGGNNSHLTYLYDGTELVYYNSTISWCDRIYVLKSHTLLTDNNGDGVLDLECVVYKQTGSIPPPYEEKRYQIIFGSDPLKIDTENDGLTDGEEDWSDYPYIIYQNDYDGDYYPNMRDWDSDNDGLKDGEEFRYYFEFINGTSQTRRVYDNDTDSDEVPSVLDSDSDNDTLPDGLEHIINNTLLGIRDIDGDGYPAMLDIDSDGDAIPDGYIEGYIYDPNLTIHQGGFYDYENLSLHNNSQFDKWEGEDKDCNGLIEGDTNYNRVWDENETFNETDPFFYDTDRDLLIDGYTPVYQPTITLFNKRGDTLCLGEWDYSCVNLDNDTDDDTLHDGFELKGWIINITDVDGNKMSKRVNSLPSTNNTDGDDWFDNEEFGLFDPANEDSDNDGLSDSFEIYYSLDPLDQDTDNDHVPDGFIDINNNGNMDYGEWETHPDSTIGDITNFTDPLDPDTDDDSLLDGLEMSYLVFRSNVIDEKYYLDGTWLYMDPGLGSYLTFWYYSNVTNANLSNVTKLPFETHDGYSIYVNLSKILSSSEEYCYYGASKVNYILIRNESNNNTFKYLLEKDYFYYLNWNEDMSDFNDMHGSIFELKYRSLLYNTSEVLLNLSNPLSNDTDGDNLNDGNEFFNLTSKNIAYIFCDIDDDSKYTLRDNDSDGDLIEDSKDLFFNNSGVWEEYYFGDFDGDGLPNALDENSDTGNDSLKDGEEDINYNGKVDSGESNPLGSTDTDHDGVDDETEWEMGLFSGINDTDSDGLIDGLDGPGGKWWLDIDNDGLICAKDIDSDGDGLVDGNVENIDGDTYKAEMCKYFGYESTDSWNCDSDNDGIWDGYNVTVTNISYVKMFAYVNGNRYIWFKETDNSSYTMIGEFGINTDPNDNDTDNDGLIDGDEVYGYYESGIILNRFTDKYEMTTTGSMMDIPITIPGNYSLGIFHPDLEDINSVTLKVFDDNNNPIDTSIVSYSNYENYYATPYDFIDLGNHSHGTEYSVKLQDFSFSSYVDLYLLRQGLNPNSNDTDNDYLLDQEEVFGYYGYFTHPLSDDSDGDKIKDMKELCYNYIANSNIEQIQLDPLNPDYDSDNIPDGLDDLPTEEFVTSWHNKIYKFSLNRSTIVEVVFPEGTGSTSYSANGVSNGQLSSNKLISTAQGYLGDDYYVTSITDIKTAKLIKTYTYSEYEDSNAKIKYNIKSQRANISYTNLKMMNDIALHSQYAFSFDPNYDYEICLLIAVDPSVFEETNRSINFGVNYGIYMDYDYNEHHDIISFNAPSLTHRSGLISQMGELYEYYGGDRIYKVTLSIPKEIIELGNSSTYPGYKQLAFDIGITAAVTDEDNSTDIIDLENRINVGSIVKHKKNYAYNIICKPDISPVLIDQLLETDSIDLETQKTEYIITDEGKIKIVNYLYDDENNEDYLKSSINGETDEIALIIVSDDLRTNDEIILSSNWSIKWSKANNHQQSLLPYNKLVINKKSYSLNQPEWLNSSGEGYLKTAKAINKLIGKYSTLKNKAIIRDCVASSIQSNKFSYTYHVIYGKSTTQITGDQTFFDGSSYCRRSYTYEVYIYDLSINENYQSEDFDGLFIECGGRVKFFRMISEVTSIVAIGYDTYTLIMDGSQIYGLIIDDDSDEMIILLLSYNWLMNSAETTVDIVTYYQGFRTLNAIRGTVSDSLGISPLGLFFEVAILIGELSLLAYSWFTAETYIQCHALSYTAFETTLGFIFDLIMLAVSTLFFPAGFVLFAVYTVLKILVNTVFK